MDLKFFKLYDDVKDPYFATEQSACFDIHAHFLTPYAGSDPQQVTVYTMDNKKELREVKMWAAEGSTFIKGIMLSPGERVLVPTGLIFDIPNGYSVRLHPRSSISLKKGLTMPNGEGIIDADYYHETFVMFYNASADEVRITDKERIAQGELIFNEDFSLKETKERPTQKTERVGGFGSTGIS